MYSDAINELEEAIKKTSGDSDYTIQQYYKKYYKNLAKTSNNKGSFLETYEKELLNYLDNHGSSEQDQLGELNARLALGALYKYSGQHKKAISQYDKAFLLEQGMIDYDAYIIDQHEVGFSADEKIGTHNIVSCVVMILCDPETKYSAFAHIDHNTDINSLSTDVISKFPTDKPLDCSLILGGKGSNDKFRAAARQNITELIEWLKQHKNINIITVDMGDKAPNVIVYSPATAEIKAKVPGKIDDNAYLRKVSRMCNFNQDPSRLVCAFDFTESKNTNALALNIPQQQEVIRTFINKLAEFVTFSTAPSEMWYANRELNPLVKVTEGIIENNSQLFKEVFEEFITHMLNDTSQISENDKLLLKTSCKFDDKTKPLVEQVTTIITIMKDKLDLSNVEMQKKVSDICSNPTTQDLKPIGQKLQEAGLSLSNKALTLRPVRSNSWPNISTTSNINKSKQKSTSKQDLSR